MAYSYKKKGHWLDCFQLSKLVLHRVSFVDFMLDPIFEGDQVVSLLSKEGGLIQKVLENGSCRYSLHRPGKGLRFLKFSLRKVYVLKEWKYIHHGTVQQDRNTLLFNIIMKRTIELFCSGCSSSTTYAQHTHNNACIVSRKSIELIRTILRWKAYIHWPLFCLTKLHQ